MDFWRCIYLETHLKTPSALGAHVEGELHMDGERRYKEMIRSALCGCRQLGFY